MLLSMHHTHRPLPSDLEMQRQASLGSTPVFTNATELEVPLVWLILLHVIAQPPPPGGAVRRSISTTPSLNISTSHAGPSSQAGSYLRRPSGDVFLRANSRRSASPCVAGGGARWPLACVEGGENTRPQRYTPTSVALSKYRAHTPFTCPTCTSLRMVLQVGSAHGGGVDTRSGW